MKRRFVVCLVQVFIFLGTSSVYSQSQLETNLQTEKEENQKIVFTPKQQELRISANDIKLIEDKENGGYHLYVKKIQKLIRFYLQKQQKILLEKTIVMHIEQKNIIRLMVMKSDFLMVKNLNLKEQNIV